jgi:hypothetical protein
MNYAATAAKTAAILAKSGAAMSLRVTTPGTYDPATGTETGATSADYACVGIVLPASKGTIEAFDNRFENGTLIEQNIRSVKLAASGLAVVPAGGDKLIINSEEWHVMGCTPLAPDGVTNIIYTLGVRRG